MIVVSHVVEVVQQLCTRAAWLHEGVLRADGDPVEVLRDYRAFLNGRIEKLRAREEDAAAPAGAASSSGAVALSMPDLRGAGGAPPPDKFQTYGTLEVSADITANGVVPLASLHELLQHPERYEHDVDGNRPAPAVRQTLS